MNKAIILLSGGLDSVVSLASIVNELDICLALIFNYGQKSFNKEFNAAKKISEYYNVRLECINLDFLKAITNTSLVTNNDIPALSIDHLDDKSLTIDSMKSVWVPNRNALFLNIAAAFADSFLYDYIIIGANKEESETFSDNSIQFINAMNELLLTSTNHQVKVLAPLIDLNKDEIVRKAIELDVPLALINSCYAGTNKHCGHCESCLRLKKALKNCNCDIIIKELFE